MQKRCTKMCNGFALHMHKLARNLHEACTKLARKLVKFSTNLHMLIFLAFNRLTAMVPYMEPLFFELRASLLTFEFLSTVNV